MATESTEGLVADLCRRFPDDSDDLRDALEELRRQKLNSIQRLARLSDSQWQRLGLPLGIESLIRDEVVVAAAGGTGGSAFAPVVATSSDAAMSSTARIARPREADGIGDEADAATLDLEDSDDGQVPLQPYEPPAGLYQRRGDSSGGQRSRGGPAAASKIRSGQGGLLSPMELSPPEDLDDLWQQLLEDTLPPDKRQALQASWETAGDGHDRYMMFLEYSSYLRKPEVSEEEKAERRKQLQPLMRELGVHIDAYSEGSQSALVWWLVACIIMLFGGIVSYLYTRSEPLPHDLQAF